VAGKLEHAQIFQGWLVAKVKRSTEVTRISKCWMLRHSYMDTTVHVFAWRYSVLLKIKKIIVGAFIHKAKKVK